MSGGLGIAIQAGGRGRRLAPVCRGRPKALAPFAGSTLLHWQLDRAAALEPDRIVVLACFGADAVRRAVGRRASVVVEAAPLGTAGGLAMLPEGPERWMTVNVDHVSDVDLARLDRDWKPPCTAVLASASVRVDEGVVEAPDGRVVSISERPLLRFLVTTGLYLFDAAALRRAVAAPARLEMPDLLRRLLPGGVHAFRHEGTWIDAGTPERLLAAEDWWGRRIGPPAGEAADIGPRGQPVLP